MAAAPETTRRAFLRFLAASPLLPYLHLPRDWMTALAQEPDLIKAAKDALDVFTKSAGVLSMDTSGCTPKFSMFSPRAVQMPVPGVRMLDPSSSVYDPLVDDERLLRAVRRQIELELLQRGRVHRADVQVADLAATQPVHHLAAVVHPLRVLQVGERAGAERCPRQFPHAFSRRLAPSAPGRSRSERRHCETVDLVFPAVSRPAAQPRIRAWRRHAVREAGPSEMRMLGATISASPTR